MKRYLWFALPLLALLGYLYERRAQRTFARRNPPPGQLIDIGGYRLHLLCMGERQPGQPTIILESGHGDWSAGWARAQPAIARFARVCAYDRAGFGWSDPGKLPRIPTRMAFELHALLEKAGEQPPYLLVGHSLGGPFGRVFAAMYPGEVTGMVWVDTAHEDMDRYLPFWPPAYYAIVAVTHLASLLARVGLPRLLGRRLMLAGYPAAQEPEIQAQVSAQAVTARFFATMRDETIGWRKAENWAILHTSLGDLPITMLEAQYTPEPPPFVPGYYWRQYMKGWRSIQGDLSQLSSQTRRVTVSSGHVIQVEQPELVVQAVREMFERLVEKM